MKKTPGPEAQNCVLLKLYRKKNQKNKFKNKNKNKKMIRTDSFKSFHSGVRKQLLSRRIEIGVVTLSFTLIVITCILSILLLLHSNKVATKGYELRKLQTNLSEISLRHQKLEAIIAEKESISLISQSSYVQEQLRPVNNIVIANRETKLAKK